jgi:hypothetical protein
MVYVSGPAVVPSSRYEIQTIVEGVNEASEANYSEPLSVATQRWGDVVASFQDPNESLTQPNILDVAGVVDKFKGLASAPIMARSDLVPDAPDGIVNILDVAGVVDAFKNFAYPYSGPTPCP